MRTKKAIAALAAMLALGLCCRQALGQDANTVRVGMYAVFYHLKADDISGPFTPPGLNANVNNLETLYFAYLRRLTSHFTVEVAAGLPPETDIVGKGPNYLGSVPYNGQKLGHATWLSPSVLLDYIFFDESARWRPYVGAGVNWTHFYAREVNPAGEAVLGGPTSISQTNSWGPAGSLGMSYRPKEHWQVIASVNYARVKSDLTLNTAGIVRHTTADFRPGAIVFAFGYTF